MNRRTRLGLLTAIVALPLVGCSAAPQTAPDQVALAALSPEPSRQASPDTYFFGAGDELGQEIFVRYVASIRANEFYATGASDFID